jgi:hypothetical protein
MRPVRSVLPLAGLSMAIMCLLASFGVRAHASDLPAGGPALKMDPFFVGGSQVHWRYCRIPGYEVLSRYPDETTKDFLRVLLEAQRLLDFVVPPDFQPRFDVDPILILCDQEVMSPMYGDLLNSSSGPGLWDSAKLGNPGRGDHYAFPNVEVGDVDRLASLVTSKGDPLSTASGLISIAHARYLLDRRTPSLPPWLVSGIMSLYVDLYSANETLPIEASRGGKQAENGNEYISMSEVRGTDADSAERLAGSNTHLQHEELVYRIPPLVWISPGKTAQLADAGQVFGSNDAERTRIMGNLLTGEPPAGPADQALWKARATLFCRWALDKEYVNHSNGFLSLLTSAFGRPVTRRFVVDGSNSPHRDAFWNYVFRSAQGPVTEASFRECFGLSYAEVAGKVADYLPVAVRTPIDLRLDWSAGEADPGLKDAGRNEISRMKGDWERMALKDVKTEYRAYASDSVKLELMHSYDSGATYPRFAALIGLLDCDLGDEVEARSFLESAVEGNVVGPRAYYELARIRYGEVASVVNSRLSAADIERVIKPLRDASQQSPHLHEGYELAAKAMAQADGITRLQLKYLNSAQQYFPRDLALMYEVASLDAANGDPEDALKLAGMCEQWAATPQDRARFTSLLGGLPR